MILAEMSFLEILRIIGEVAGLIATISALIPTIITMVKRGKELIKNKNWNKIKEIANAAMIAAEAKYKQGADKQEAVIAAVKQACIEGNIPLDEEVLSNLVDYINSFIGYHNDMTQAKKDLNKQERDAKKKAKELK